MGAVECFGRWRVLVDEDVIKFFAKRGILGELEAWRRELEESLNWDPQAVNRLLREPIVRRVRGVNVRRYRLNVRGKPFRLVYVVNIRECIVIFFWASKRDEETYVRLRRME